MKGSNGFVWVERIGVAIGGVLIVGAAIFANVLDANEVGSALWILGGLALCVGAWGFTRKRDPKRD